MSQDPCAPPTKAQERQREERLYETEVTYSTMEIMRAIKKERDRLNALFPEWRQGGRAAEFEGLICHVHDFESIGQPVERDPGEPCDEKLDAMRNGD